MRKDYFTYFNEDNVMVKVQTSLELVDDAPDQNRPFLGYVFIKIDDTDEHGWCKLDQCNELSQIESSLNDTVLKELNAVQSGSRMQDGWYEIFYYLGNNKRFVTMVRSVMEKYPDYAYEPGSYRDAKWEHYFNEIYPDPLMLQQIKSRFIISELEEAGDNLDLERPVEHYVFFQTKPQRERSVKRLSEHGYALQEELEHEDEYRFGAIVVKTHNVLEETLMTETSTIMEIAFDEHGLYEGWSTTLA